MNKEEEKKIETRLGNKRKVRLFTYNTALGLWLCVYYMQYKEKTVRMYGYINAPKEARRYKKVSAKKIIGQVVHVENANGKTDYQLFHLVG